MTSPNERDSGRALPDLVDSAASETDPRAPLESITEVNGTVARFEMAYSPKIGERIAFGPPLRQMLPSLLFLVFALALVGMVIAAHVGSSNSRLYVWLVEGDRNRPIGSAPLSFIVLMSALGTVLRARMRGVVVHADGLEARYLLPMGLPRIRRWAWPQVERIIFDPEHVMLELWDGTYERLADVADTPKLSAVLEAVAASRKMRVTHLPTIAGRGRVD